MELIIIIGSALILGISHYLKERNRIKNDYWTKYRKSKEPVRVKNIALTAALENAKTIKTLSSDDLNLVNRLLRISLEKEVE